jgi:hypothetical protein
MAAWTSGLWIAAAFTAVLPDCPWSLLPQHDTAPDARAQVWDDPTAIWLTPEMPLATTGVMDDLVDPSPSCPWSFAPQHNTLPLETTAHPWLDPTATSTAWLTPLTVAGVDDAVEDPSPSWPESLPPQHLIPPFDVMVQLDDPPADNRPACSCGADVGEDDEDGVVVVQEATPAAARETTTTTQNERAPARARPGPNHRIALLPSAPNATPIAAPRKLDDG